MSLRTILKGKEEVLVGMGHIDYFPRTDRPLSDRRPLPDDAGEGRACENDPVVRRKVGKLGATRRVREYGFTMDSKAIWILWLLPTSEEVWEKTFPRQKTVLGARAGTQVSHRTHT